MEEVLLRFSHIGEGIYKELNGKDFCKSMEVTRSWNYFIRDQRVLQRAYKVHKAIGIQRIHKMIQTLTKEISRYERSVQKTVPFHLAAERGYFAGCQQIMENSNDKNPKDRTGYTPLHKAAENGHLSVCQLILENVDDKNPKNWYGETPFHCAALKGHLPVCQLIVDNVDDKNPKNNFGQTPLQLATIHDHQGIKTLIDFQWDIQLTSGFL